MSTTLIIKLIAKAVLLLVQMCALLHLSFHARVIIGSITTQPIAFNVMLTASNALPQRSVVLAFLDFIFFWIIAALLVWLSAPLVPHLTHALPALTHPFTLTQLLKSALRDK